MALAFAPIGKEVRITKINADEKMKRHLENLGFNIGSTVTAVLESGGNIVLKVKDCKIALNKALAMKILVA